MSKNINVNPGQYKTEGRERQGENIHQGRHKRDLTRTRARVAEDFQRAARAESQASLEKETGASSTRRRTRKT